MKIRFLLVLSISLLITLPSAAQSSDKKLKVTGKVVDANKTPVAGAVVIVDNIRTNIATNAKGVYRIKVSPSAYRIGISTIGNEVVQEAIDGRTVIDFTLETAFTSVRELPSEPILDTDEDVNVGYGTLKRRNLTHQVGRIDGRDQKYASYNSIYDMIRGELAGVKVEGKKITIQGASSLIMGTDPLLVVDGVPVNTIDDIMPQMVSSIEVLKGAAASIYGSRGANGVILISLKRAPAIQK